MARCYVPVSYTHLDVYKRQQPYTFARLTHMYKYLIMRIMLLAFYLMMSIASFGQGTTSGSITGKITDNNGTTLPGVTVIATHTPSGTIMGTVTNEDGFFRLENLRVGGPYTVRASYTGFGEVALEGIEIRIGESQKYDFEMSEAITELTTVEVVASAGNTGENAGASTHISTEAIERLPTLNRDIDDFLRLTPQASASVSYTHLDVYKRQCWACGATTPGSSAPSRWTPPNTAA